VIVRVQRIIHELGVALPERGIRKPNLAASRRKISVFGSSRPRWNDRFGTLQELLAVGRIDIGMLEMRAGGQNHVRVRHAVRHRHVDADNE